MKAVMLAAGIGARLGRLGAERPPKILLRFGGKSLLQRHVEILRRHGVVRLVLGVGYHRQEIEQEIAGLGAEDFVRTVFNEDYDEGNIVTLWTLRNELCWGGPVLLMDADVKRATDEILPRILTAEGGVRAMLRSGDTTRLGLEQQSV